jgi:hypothetical protein
MTKCGRFDKAERKAIRHADDIGAEARSQDTEPGRPKTKHGYDKEGCVSTDEDLRTDSSSEDDTTSVFLGSDASSDESDGEAERREEVVHRVFRRFAQFDTDPTAEIPAIVLNRRTGRSEYMDLLLNSWLLPHASLSVSQAVLFLKMLKLLPQECCNEIYSHLARSVKLRSKDIHKCLYRCIKAYLPEQSQAYNIIHIKYKDVKVSVASPSVDKKKPKPTVPKPTIRKIEDIEVVTFQFYNEWKRYEHDHQQAGYQYSSLFACLTTDQQAVLCDMTKHTIASIESLDTEAQLDLFRGLFGLKSSAATIDRLSDLEFEGDALDPAAWAAFRARFQKTLNLAPRSVRPPDNEQARRFVYACPLKMLKADVQARKPTSLAQALDHILGRLNDPGFLRSVASKAVAPPRRDRDFRDQRVNRVPPNAEQALHQPEHRRPSAMAPNARPSPPQRPNDVVDHPKAAQTGAPHNHGGRPQHPPCRRCRKLDHTEDACISKHDVEGKRLEPLDAGIYQQHKLLYFRRKDAAKAAIDDNSSITSDSSLLAVDSDSALDGNESDVDCVCTLSTDCSTLRSKRDDAAPTFCVPPAPRLVGIEPNPGPSLIKRKRPQPSAVFISNCHPTLTFGYQAHTTSYTYSHSANSTVCAVGGLSLAFLLLYCWRISSPSPFLWSTVAFTFGKWWFSRTPPPQSATFSVPCTLSTSPDPPPEPDPPSNPTQATALRTSPPIRPIFEAPTSTTSIGDLSVRATDQLPSPLLPPMPPLVDDSETSDSEAEEYAPAARLVGIEPNPGPPTVTLLPSVHKPPRRLMISDDDPFQPRPVPTDPTESPAGVAHAEVSCAAIASVVLSPFHSTHVYPDSASASSDAHSVADAVLPFLDSDSSVTSDPDLHVCVSNVDTTPDFVPPPKFIGFPCPPGTTAPPPAASATICAIDTMCLGEYSVISHDLATSLKLPLKPFSKTSRTATGATVKCSSLALFWLFTLINGQWQSIPGKALVWEHTSQPLLLCNSWALQSGYIDMVQPHAIRCSLFGHTCFNLNWEQDILLAHDNDLICYHADVMDESDDDVVDLSAPLKVGDQDVSLLPPDAKEYAKRYPIMTKALPFNAHPDLEKWRAHVVTEDLAKYSWPKCDLADLKEDKFPMRALPAIHAEFDKLISQGFAEELRENPTSVVMKAQLVAKSKTERRFCVNGSQQKKVLRVGVYPMPNIRNIFNFVAAFPWRAKIDLKWGYYNFEIHDEDKKWTVTIGGGRAIQWRKLVQGFASSGAFFQYAMTKLLGPAVVGIIAEVYLDDLIIVGHNKAECEKNVETVMDILNSKNFRVNFAKCQFTPGQSIEFLGCRLVDNVVHPGPKVGLMLSKIQPFFLHSAPKAQKHHLHVFLGMCAYLLNHCPGLKQALHPLYLAVASDPFLFGELERQSFRTCHAILSNLQVYHLPSADPRYTLEIHSDASGGSGTKIDPGQWGSVLGQRYDVATPVFAEGFELIQLDGGSFNERQAKWDIQRKEMFALYRAVKAYRHFVYGRPFRIIIDSKVLMLMHRSSVPMVQRWYAYIQGHEFQLIHFSSDRNCLADGITRCVQVLPPPTCPPAPRLVGIEPNPGPQPSLIILSSDTSQLPSPEASPPTNRSDDDAPLVAPVVPVSTPALLPQVLPAAATPATPKRRRRPSARPIVPVPDGPAVDSAPIVANPIVVAPSPVVAGHQQSPRLLNTRPITVPHRVHRSFPVRTMPTNPTSPWPSLFIPRPLVPLTAPYSDHMMRHQLTESPNSFFCALSEAISHADAQDMAAGHYPLPDTPSHVVENCRESIVAWMRSNATVTHAFLDHSCPQQLREELYHNTQHVLFSKIGDKSIFQPNTWAEYIHLILNPLVEADELVLKCAAMCFRVQIVVAVHDHGTKVFAPPHAMRRVHLLFCPRRRHFQWCHRVEDICNDSDACTGSATWLLQYDAPALTSAADEPPAQRARLGDAHHITRTRLSHIANAHNGFTGHPGVAATCSILQSRNQQWRGMTAQVTQFIAQCPTCTLARIHLNPARAAISTLRLMAPPLRRWHCDNTGPMEPCLHTGFTRIQCAVCESTGYVVLQGSRVGSSLELVLALVHIVGTYGLFESFHTDQGPENEAYVLHQFQKLTGLKHTCSIPTNPETNGLVERTISTVKRFLRCMIADGVARHNGWGLMLPILQQSINSTACGPLNVSPNSVVFASLYTPDAFVIPTTYLDSPQEVNIADGNYHHPNANFVTRAVYFQQLVTNRRHDLLMQSMRLAESAPEYMPETIPEGSQVLIPWPHGRPPTSMHPYRRGPYIVTQVSGNVLSLVHATAPLPDQQPAALRWSRQAQIFTLDPILERSALDPSAVNVPTGVPLQHPIDCVLDYTLIPSFTRGSDPALSRHDVRNQIYTCRLFATNTSIHDISNWRRDFYYEDIQHTLAFDSFYAQCPFLEGHVPVASMPATWDPRAASQTRRPAHDPVIDAERALPLDDVPLD